ncbi:type VI secretion system tip protein VgrG, partial [Escherichia sp. 93.0816]|nr:type VI secretion system tip protein VgrG [Escherichia sp. 93.0816]
DGSFIQLQGKNIILGCEGNILWKCVNAQKMGATSYTSSVPDFPGGYSEFFVAHDNKTGQPMPDTRYRITTGKGIIYSGVTDSEGKTAEIFTALPEKIKVELG